MNKFLLLIALSLLPSIALAAPASPNLLQCGGFETHGAIRPRMSAWPIRPAGPGIDAGIDTTVAHSGQASYRITAADSAPAGWAEMGQPLAAFIDARTLPNLLNGGGFEGVGNAAADRR